MSDTGMTLERFMEIGRQAHVSIAAGGYSYGHTFENPHGRLPPDLWEDLRVEMQNRYRLATGEEFAVLKVENSHD